MPWSVRFVLPLLLFHSLARTEVASTCAPLLAAHVAENRGFIPWSRLHAVLVQQQDATLVLKVRNVRPIAAPEIAGYRHLTLRGGALSTDPRTHYFTLSGWPGEIYKAREAFTAAFGPSLQFQAVALEPQRKKVDVHRPGPFGRGAKALRKRLGDWWWARGVASVMLFIDNAYVALRDDLVWPTKNAGYHRFLAMTDPNPALVEAAKPTPKPTPVRRPAPIPTPSPTRPPGPAPSPRPLRAARGPDRLRPRGIDNLYAFLKAHLESAEELSQPNVVRDIFKRLFAKVRGAPAPLTDEWLDTLFRDFSYDASLSSSEARRPVIDAWAELFFVLKRRPRSAVFNGASIARDVASWPFPGAAPPPTPRPTYLKAADRLRDEDVTAMYDFVRERTGYSGDLGAPGVMRDLFSTMFTKLQGWRDPARTEWLGTLFSAFDYEASLRAADDRRAVVTAWRKLFAEVHRRAARGPFTRRQLELDIAAWPYAGPPVPPPSFAPERIAIDEFDEVELRELTGGEPDIVSHAREVIARAYRVAPASGRGRTIRLEYGGGIDLVVEDDPNDPGGLMVKDVRKSKIPRDAYWAHVAAAANLKDEVVVIEGGTLQLHEIETDEVLVPAAVRARLEFEAGVAFADVTKRIAEMAFDEDVVEVLPFGPHAVKLEDVRR